MTARDDPPPPPLGRDVVVLLAVLCGAAVANIYYAQPLLDEIAGSLDVSRGTASLVITASQAGFAVGLALIVPLGDLLERRALITRMLLVTAAGLAAVAAAPSFAVLAVAIAVVGVSTVAAQVVIPMASALAAEEEAGRVVGIVMSGLLLGVLSARTVSGLLAEIGGWRLVYAVASGLMLVCCVGLRARLPANQGEGGLSYGSLLRSIPHFVRTEPVLRRRILFSAMGMVGFTTLWTSMTFMLTDEYGWSEGVIGLFGLLGVAGAASAQLAGRLADRGRGDVATGAFLACVLASWALMVLGPWAVPALAAGIVLFDFGLQGQHISNQHAIFGLVPEARSRLMTAYMVGTFVSGAIGTVAAAAVYDAGGWEAVSCLGALAATIALLGWVSDPRR